eukprot:365969-Chlamydomonas_euryale.AAC.8
MDGWMDGWMDEAVGVEVWLRTRGVQTRVAAPKLHADVGKGRSIVNLKGRMHERQGGGVTRLDGCIDGWMDGCIDGLLGSRGAAFAP